MSTTSDPVDKKMVALFAAYLLQRLAAASAKGGDPLPAAELSVIRAFLADNAVTLASVRRGDFGQVAQAAADEFPFNDDGSTRGEAMMGASPSAKH